MTSEVIDAITSACQPEGMDGIGARYDRTLRVVMWLDAFWSAAATLLAIGGSLAVALLGLPHGAQLAVGLSALVAAVFLAACGALTGVLLMLRMNAGHYTMPPGLRVPLPKAMVPTIGPDS